MKFGQGRFPPAKVLPVLRDQLANDWPSLCRRFNLDPKQYHTDHMRLSYVLRDLRDAGLIRIEKELQDEPDWAGRIEISEQWERIQTALGMSLAEFAKLTSNRGMVVEPLFGRPLDPPTKSDVFVLMPFTEALRPVYTDHIAKVAQSLKLTISRADDLFSAQAVMRDIWNALYHAKLIIADCTDRNPNVFYEIGLAHVIGKTVILITQRQEDIPFDIRHYRFIEYKYTPREIKTFEASLRETLKAELPYDEDVSE